MVKRGRTFTTVTGSLDAGERRLLQVDRHVRRRLAGSGGPERVDAAPPDLPPPDECVRVVPTDTFPPPFMGRVDLRLHPDDAGFSVGCAERRATRAWLVPAADDEPIDTLGLVLATDAFPPTAFNARLPVAWTPTVELTAHVRAARRRAGCAAPSRPASSPAASSRRTARSGTAPAASSPRAVSWPSSPRGRAEQRTGGEAKGRSRRWEGERVGGEEEGGWRGGSGGRWMGCE